MNRLNAIAPAPASAQHRLFLPARAVDWTRIDRYWADFLGCTMWQFCGARQTLVITNPAQAGLWAVARQGSWLVTLPPGWLEILRPQLDQCFRPGMLPKAEDLTALFAHLPPQEWYGPALIFIHEPDPAAVGTDGLVRPVTLRDERAVASFAAATPIPWTLAEPQIWRKVFGLFVGERLVSSCAVRVWGDLLAEIYIDTDPAFRCRGYGKAVTHAALQWIQQDTPYYAESVVELTNRASVKLLSHLGGRPYGYTIMSFPKT
jgi:GNAT superfamily N-acetyltransferase